MFLLSLKHIYVQTAAIYVTDMIRFAEQNPGTNWGGAAAELIIQRTFI